MLNCRRIVAACAAGMMILVGGCRAQPQSNEATGNGANSMVPKVPLPPFPLPQAPLNREDLLLALEHSASDFAAGIDDGERQRELSDSKFEFRISFGCSGPDPKASKPDFGWSLNSKTHALRVHAKPTLSKTDAAVNALADDNFEAVEGFWIGKPWLLKAVCPRSPQRIENAAEQPSNSIAAELPKDEASSSALAPAFAETVGIAQFFTASDARTMRRDGRSYEATKRLDEGDEPTGGFDLVLSGRLKALPNDRVIACTSNAAGGRPACVISVEFGKVWIERADTHDVLAQWGSG